MSISKRPLLFCSIRTENCFNLAMLCFNCNPQWCSPFVVFSINIRAVCKKKFCHLLASLAVPGFICICAVRIPACAELPDRGLNRRCHV